MVKETIKVTSLNEIQRKTRKVWTIKPFSRVASSKKVYSRKGEKPWLKDLD